MHIGLLGDPSSFHTRKWASGLQRGGARVTIFSFSADPWPGAPCVQVLPPARAGRSLNYRWYLQGGKALASALATAGVDVVSALHITPFGVWAARSGHHPLVLTAMGSDVLVHAPDPPAELGVRNRANQTGRTDWRFQLRFQLKRRFFRYHVRRALHAADLVTGDNQVLVDAVVDWFGVPRERTQLNRWGIEPEHFTASEAVLEAVRQRYGIRPGQAVVLCPRGVLPVYQADRILAACARVLATGRTDARFLFLAAGYNVPEGLMQQAQALAAMHDDFYLETTRIPREAMGALWQLTDVFISAPVYDGYSNAVAEGRYAGAVPVVNVTPATEEIFTAGETAVMVDPFTPERLAEALTEVLDDLPRWQAAFAPRNRAWVTAQGLLSDNIARFLAACETLLASEAS